MSPPKLLKTGYDLAQHPTADEFDPVSWYENTGEDAGLPTGYVEKQKKKMARLVAAETAAREAQSRGADPDSLYAKLLVEEAIERAIAPKPRLALVGLGATPADIDAFVNYLKGGPASRGYNPDEPRVESGPEGGEWTSGGAPGSSAKASKDLVRQGLAGGFTYRPFAGAPTDGFMVSPYQSAELQVPVDQFTAAKVSEYRLKHAALLAKPNHYFGGWRDGNTVYLDVSIRAPTFAAGMALAKQYDQLAIYDLAKGETTYLKAA